MSDDAEYLRLFVTRSTDLGKSTGMERTRGLEIRYAARHDRSGGADRTSPTSSAQLEAVVRWYRPVLMVTDDHFVTKSDDDEGDPRFVDPNKAASKGLMDALEKHRTVLDPALRSVGRIELTNNFQFPWVGTGWLIGSDLGSDIIVTNAHVVREFGMRSGEGYVFRPGIPARRSGNRHGSIFAKRSKMTSPREFPITDIIWISDLPGLDICLLRVARMAGADRIDPPIQLRTNSLTENAMLAVVGYPGSNNGYDPAPFQNCSARSPATSGFRPASIPAKVTAA